MHRDSFRRVRFGEALFVLFLTLPFLYGPASAQAPPAALRIETADAVPLGDVVELSLSLDSAGAPPGFAGFDLLIAFHPDDLSLTSVAPGPGLIDCDWEYFTYRSAIDSTAPLGDFSARLRIVALAETNNGDIHPSCFLDTPGELAVLTFVVASDSSRTGDFLPVRFYWIDCGDNALVDPSGDTLYISRDVYEYGQIITADNNVPGITGAPSSCLVDPMRTVFRGADFYHGGVPLLPGDSTGPADTVKARLRLGNIPSALPGDTIETAIYLDSIAPGFESGGIGFFIRFDSTALKLIDIQPGQALLDCAWENFIWRLGTDIDCDGPCPTGTVRIVAIADDFVPPHQTICRSLSPGELVRLKFAVDNDPSLRGSSLDLQWFWNKCPDNEWASKYGDSLFLSRRVYSHDLIDITAEGGFPNVTGAPSTCLTSPTVSQAIDYRHGQIAIAPGDTITEPVRIMLLPPVLYALQANGLEPVPTTLYIGDLRDCPLDDIAPESIRLNGSIAPLSYTTVPAPPGFINPTALAVTFDARELIWPLLPVWDTVSVAVAATWTAPVGCAQGAVDTITVIGHRSGDVNGDGLVNLSDMTELVAALFGKNASEGPPPSTDINCSGSTNVADLSALVNLLYR